MKTEILISVAVLSLIVLMALNQFINKSSLAAPLNQTQTANSPRNTSNSSSNLQATGSTSQKQRPIVDLSDSNHLIRRAAQTISELPPLKARLRYKIDMFGEKFSGPGAYYQKGQGTRLARIEFQFASDGGTVELHQFCDGEFLYSLSTVGKESKLEFVDLRQLKAQQANKSSNRLANWLSVGSLSGLLRQLEQHFEFGAVRRHRLAEIPVIEVTGRWKPESLARLLEGQIDPMDTDGRNIDWRKIPRHLPHQVQLTLGNDDSFPLFPYRIIFQQIDDDQLKRTFKSIAELQLYHLQKAPEMNDSMFQLPSVEATPADLTEFYKARIKQFTRGH